MSDCNCDVHTRRRILSMGTAVAVWVPYEVIAAESNALPLAVAGIEIPHSPLALKALRLSRTSCPNFLVNHCLRTFVFGALAMRSAASVFNTELAFVAAVLHDMGLVQENETPGNSFEIDGANVAEKFMRDAGASAPEADIVWHAVEMHDGKFALTRRQGPEAMLVAIGAGSDVDGYDPKLDPKLVTEIVTTFPRLQFKRRFTALAIDHCKRKPTSQRGTWLEGLCREQVPGAWTGTIENEIADAPFAE